MINALLLSLIAFAPADTPIEPLDETLITMSMATPEGIGVCTAAGDVGDAIDDLAAIGGADVGIRFKDMAVGYFGDILEDGMGPDYALTLEAEAAFESWIADCLG